ncbi:MULTISPECIES: cation diffusion facilitator family transporter [unclassified Pseudodesulfovibrio]|uniref:cation diffusion facilitator family transporter n=1 Tax=unclassified Pseudodesulfovibrio TaxID=2661612 RepID=UPI000FEBADE4|nr:MULTISPECIES: cation diffusion facilitator family transporter [unclassified Pseudodesulfovibrio]MCJ2165912.1 cation diffusion facilitator family transporter [Pseudodesulfovibrio sp. S3-i]RWU02656.1 cation transporter [Pseudodesulfovibrio sp. S3]
MIGDSPKRYAIYSIGASILTLTLKFGAWSMTDSVGLLSDATESLVNLTAGVLALTAITISMRPADSDHAYGHGKAEYFSSSIEGVLIIVAAFAIGYTAIHRFLSPQELTNLGPGLVLALISSVINFVTAKVMLKAASRFDSITLEADARHLLTDVWTSVGLVAGLSIIIVMPQWKILDPIIALVMAGNIVFTGVSLIRRSVGGLMDDALPEEELEIIAKAIASYTGHDSSFHGLRTRKSGPKRFIDFHLLVPGTMSVRQSHDLCELIEELIQSKLSRAEVTIHVEPLECETSYDGKNVGGECAASLGGQCAAVKRKRKDD